jgi:FkbM family methyltransferase
MVQSGDGSVVAGGAYGEFEGAADDRVVFGTYRTSGTWSPQLVSLIAERLLGGGGGTLIDVGANIGLVAIAALERSRACCVAFEPEPDNHARLCRNVRRHGLQARMEMHRVALDAESGEVELALCAGNSGDHRLAHGSVPDGWSRLCVPAVRLDEVLAGRELARPVVMKLDAQGAEVRVLHGAQRTLAQVDALIVEWWPAGLVRMGDSANALYAALSAFPYAALLDQHAPAPRTLQDSAQLFASMAWIPADGSDEGFFDLLLSKSQTIA